MIRKSAIVYTGPSRLDPRARITAIVTGLTGGSKNPKTGPMAQLWIIRDDLNPIEAVHTRQDYAVCGDCKLRGSGLADRACYVTIAHSPLAVFKARHQYETLSPDVVNGLLQSRGLSIRLGAYGDPGALPLWLLRDLTHGVRFTGYTHAWKSIHPDYALYVMASVDTLSEMGDASAKGYRTFRARLNAEPLASGEIACPASDEMGHRTTCERCGLCNGSTGSGDNRRQIAIVVHGSGVQHFIQLRKAE